MLGLFVIQQYLTNNLLMWMKTLQKEWACNVLQGDVTMTPLFFHGVSDETSPEHTLGNAGLELNSLYRLLAFIISSDHLSNCEVGVTVIFILLRRTIRLRKIKWLAQVHTANKIGRTVNQSQGLWFQAMLFLRFDQNSLGFLRNKNTGMLRES